MASLTPAVKLLALPVVQRFDCDAVAELLAACVESAAQLGVLKAVLALPAAAQLSAEQVRGLVETSAQQRHANALKLLLQHSAAPRADDSELQLLLCACGNGITF